jgi:hypothetical protein
MKGTRQSAARTLAAQAPGTCDATGAALPVGEDWHEVEPPLNPDAAQMGLAENNRPGAMLLGGGA